MDDLRVGAFRLHEPIAEGGMGVIWIGEHATEALPVAIKILKPAVGEAENFVRAFRKEVRAVASLNHPHVIRVFDSGVLTDPLPGSSGEELPAGSPYLVMERAFGGTLKDRRSQMSWPFLYDVTAALLDALAHAHARGVLHRDLKPSNVLLGVGADRQLRLTDFGLAFPREFDVQEIHQSMLLTHAGTPNYMAPEQALGTWRDFTPATDLYALGCVLWYLSTGRQPFRRRRRVETIFAQIESSPPGFVPLFECPDGYELWLRKLLHKDALDRPQRAVEAFAELEQLASGWVAKGLQDQGGGAPEPFQDQATEQLSEAFDTMASTLGDTGLGLSRTTLAGVPCITLEEPPGPNPVPLPADWRQPELPPPRPQLFGVGMGLYGQRDIPLVGREPERDQLWEILTQVQTEGTCQAVLLEGPAGCGKSRLARWLAERADEVSGVSLLRAVHSPTEGPCDGLGPMVRRAFSCVRLDHEEILTRLDHCLAERKVYYPWDEAAALCELMDPLAEESRETTERSLSFDGPVDRFSVIERLLRREAARRPTILWLDDVQWAAEALSFVDFLLHKGVAWPFPCLVLMTARREALAIRPRERHALESLQERPDVQTIGVPALPDGDRETLVAQLLPLEERLARRVAARTGGNPLFATHLVGDWVQRRLLEVGQGGFVLREGADDSLPDDLHQVWVRRMDRIVAGGSEADTRSVQLAFALGQEVDLGEWLAACQHEEISPSLLLLDRLVDDGLATLWEDASGFSLVHGMLRESVLKMLAGEGVLESAHLTCAAMLIAVGDPHLAHRTARHLLAGGAAMEALVYLEEADDQLSLSGRHRLIPGLLDDWRGSLELCGVPESDPRWGRYLLAEAYSYRELRGDNSRFGALAEKMRREGWEGLRADHLLADSMWMKPTDALRELDECIASHPPSELRSRLQVRRGAVLANLGRSDDALAELETARGIDLEAVSLRLRGWFAGECGFISERLGLLADSRSYMEARLDYVEQTGSVRSQALTLIELGDIHRALGEFEEAGARFRRADELVGSFDRDSMAGFFPKINLAILAADTGDYAQALAQGTELLTHPSAVLPHLEVALNLLLAAAHAGLGDWEAWEARFSVSEWLKEGPTAGVNLEPDHGRLALIAGRLLHKAGLEGQAGRALSFARAVFTQLNRPEDLARVDAVG